MAWTWDGSGSVATIDWGDRRWTLDLETPCPGLVHDGVGPLLALDGLAAPGRREPSAFSGASLRKVERRLGRMEATYVPQGWADLRLRASWGLHGSDAIDLEIQLSAQSVDALRRIEVMVASLWPIDEQDPRIRWVEARDARAASLSYDGREPNLDGLTTLPPDSTSLRKARVLVSASLGGYIEMIHPDDVTRRISEGGSTRDLSHSTRYGLFGYDLEKGVVLRGRLRAAWVPGQVVQPESIRRMAEFLDEPPPLGP
jgi:hypothetical protein